MASNQTISTYGTEPQRFIEQEPKSKKRSIKGLNFPLGSNKKSGGFFNNESGIALVKDAVQQLLKTERGERVMLPRFGCNLRKYLFQPLDENTFNDIKEEISFSFYNYIVGAEILKLRVTPYGETGPLGGNSLLIQLTLGLQAEDLTVFDVEVLIQ
jgi:phage baseplate assembly protein W